MTDNMLFTYNIDFLKVNVYHSEFQEKSSLINKEFYNGIIAAIAEYLYYPVEVVAPRIQLFSVRLEYDRRQLEDVAMVAETYIAECTKEAFLIYMEESLENSRKIIPDNVITPDLNPDRIKQWCESLRIISGDTEVNVNMFDSEESELKWVEFSYEHGTFYGRYRDKGFDRLLVSLPGYNSDWNDLSAYMDGEYDLLQLSPLGYNTPHGFDEKKRVKGAWPVLYDTVSEIEEVGYNRWFFEVCLAIKALRKREQSLLFIGTSQGGGASLILSSIFNDCTLACASEMPFLIGFSDFNYSRVRDFVASQINNPDKMIYDFCAKERLFVIDPIMHSSRIVCPTLLIAGEQDTQCLPKDIYKLYQTLKCEKKYIELENQEHGYSKEFMKYARQWICNV